MGYGILKGKKGIIFGALDKNSIAWKAAEKAANEGAEIVLTNAPIAIRMGVIDELAQKINSPVIPADATSLDDLKKLFEEAQERVGGKLDFVLHSVGMSVNVRKGKHYTNLDYNWLEKGWDISAVSFHKVMRAAWDLDAINRNGSILALSYIAAQRVFPDYNDMADNKAYLESVARSFGYHWGVERGVRVNTISQSPTSTTAGKGIKGFGSFLSIADKMSPLGNASAEDCAAYIVMMFSDFTKKVTLQNLFHDGGFSSVGISQSLMDTFSEE